MVAPLDARTIEDGTIGRVLVEDLALQDAAVFECQMEHIPVRGIGHGIEPHHGRLSIERLQAVAHAAHVAMTTMQTPDTVDRMSLRHWRHSPDGGMQRPNLQAVLDEGHAESFKTKTRLDLSLFPWYRLW
jgi:hypothetical protein